WVVLQPNQRRTGLICFHHLATLRVKDLGMALHQSHRLPTFWAHLSRRYTAEVVAAAGQSSIGHPRPRREALEGRRGRISWPSVGGGHLGVLSLGFALTPSTRP